MPNGLSTLQKSFLPKPFALTPPATHETTGAVAHEPLSVAAAFGLSGQEAAVAQRDAMAHQPCLMTAMAVCNGTELDGINAVQRGLSIQPAWEGAGQIFLAGCARQPICGHAHGPVRSACPSSSSSMSLRREALSTNAMPSMMAPPSAH